MKELRGDGGGEGEKGKGENAEGWKRGEEEVKGKEDFKGTVSPDFYVFFIIYESVLSVWMLMV